MNLTYGRFYGMIMPRSFFRRAKITTKQQFIEIKIKEKLFN